MPTFVQNSHDKDLLIAHTIVNLKFEFFNPYFTNISFDSPCRTRIVDDVLELALDSDHEILAEPGLLLLEKSLCALKIKAHGGIENNTLQSIPASNSSREIGLVFPSL